MESHTKKKTLLVTGSTGFVGSTFLKDYSEVYEIKTVDIRRSPLTSDLFRDIDTIVHCAGLAHQMNGAPDENYFQANYHLTKNIASIAKENGVNHFIYLSTAHVFGEGSLTHQNAPLTEYSKVKPVGAYAKSKIEAETFLRDIETPSFTVSIVRPPMVYGEGAKGNMPRLFRLVRRLPILPLGFDQNKRSMVFVSNLTYFISRLIETRSSGIFIPQDATPISTGNLVQLIAKAQDIRCLLINPGSFLVKILSIVSPKNAIRLFGSLYFDSSDSNQKIGYVPKYTTLEGLKKMSGMTHG